MREEGKRKRRKSEWEKTESHKDWAKPTFKPKFIRSHQIWSNEITICCGVPEHNLATTSGWCKSLLTNGTTGFESHLRQVMYAQFYTLCSSVIYRCADKSLAQTGRKQDNVSVRMAWISFCALPYRGKKNLMIARVSMLLKPRASLTCFRASFLPGRAKDLSAPRYIKYFNPTCADYSEQLQTLYHSGVLGGVSTPSEIPKAFQNRAKLNPIVKTVKNCRI